MAMESSVTCNSRVAAVDPFPRGEGRLGRPVRDVPESSGSGSDVRSSRYQPAHFVEDCYNVHSAIGCA